MKTTKLIPLFLLMCCTFCASAQTNISGIISSNTTWDLAGSPYIITGTTLLDSGFTLTIRPGVTVKFASHKSIQVSGILRAVGKPDSLITFTSNAAQPAPGDWDYILLNNKSKDFVPADSTGSILSYCVVEYGGGSVNGTIVLMDAFPFISHCIVRDNNNSGLFANYSSTDADHPNGVLEVRNNLFRNNSSTTHGGGLNVFLGQFTSNTIRIAGCTFHDNFATNTGGAVYVADALSNSYVYITDNTIFENTAATNGGGIIIFSFSATSSPGVLQHALVSDNKIYRNHAGEEGGGVSIHAKGEFKNNIIFHNTAATGAGIAEIGINTSNNVIAGNVATSSHAAYYSNWFGDPLTRNQIVDNVAPNFIAAFSNDIGVYNYNTITRNTTTLLSPTSAVHMGGSNNCSVPANCNNNNLFGNRATYQFRNERPQNCDINFKNSWWGTTSGASIDSAIFDFQDNSALSIVFYTGFRSSPDTIAPVTPPVHVIKTDLGGGNIKVSWNANPEADIAGYKIHWGTPTGYSFSNSLDAGNVLNDTISGISVTDTIAVTAYDINADGVKDQFEGHESWFTTATGRPVPDFSVIATTVCTGDSVLFTNKTAEAGPYSNTTWSWSFPGGTPSESQAKNPKVVYHQSGMYSIKLVATNIAGVDSILFTDYIAVDTLPDPHIMADGPITFCAGDSVTLDAGIGFDTYSWTNGAAEQTITVNQSGTFGVTVSNHCGSTSDQVTVTVNPLPVPAINASGPTTFCEGNSVMLTASGGASYSWSNAETTQSITTSSAGDYTVTVTSAQGCSATSDTTTVIVNPLPAATVTPDNATTFCEGGNVTLAASPGASYFWNTGATTAEINVSSSGDFSVTVTDGNGCSSGSDTTTVTVHSLPTATVTANDPTTFCEGGSVMLSANTATAYLWSSGETTKDISVSASGNYSVTITDGNGCVATSQDTSVTVHPAPDINVTPGGPTTFCQGGTLTLSATAGTSYSWTTGETAQSILVSASGDYAVSVTDINGCIGTSDTTSVTVKPLPEISAEDASRCGAGAVTLTASGTGAKSWFDVATGGNSLGTGDTFTTPSLTSNATYFVESTLDGCTGTSRESVQAIVIIVSQPSISVNNSDPSAPVLTSSSNGGNQWFIDGTEIDGAVGNTHVVSEPGAYSVQATVEGCVSPMSEAYEFVLTGIESLRSGAVTVYPNPASHILFISLSGFRKNQPVSITITDLLGRSLYNTTKSGGDEIRVDLADFRPGKYIVLIRQKGSAAGKIFFKEQ
jgi:predicted outer membrane repeat protein